MPEVDKMYRSAADDNVDTRQYETIFNNAGMGIVLTDRSGGIIHLNRFAELLFGYRRDELAGQSFDLLIPQMSRDGQEGYWEYYCHYPPTRATDEVRVLYALRKDGSEFSADINIS